MIYCLHTIHVLCNVELDSEGAVCAESSGHNSGGRQRVVACLTLQEARQRQGQGKSQKVQMDNSGRPATQSHGKLPGAEPRQRGGGNGQARAFVWRWNQPGVSPEEGGRFDCEIADHQLRGQTLQGPSPSNAEGGRSKSKE